ncbi:MAG: Gfo/Idh/MocA family oxidoreductase, partial [Geminicoccaceae bacterium]
MPARPLRIGLVGAGYVAPFHLRGWAGLDSAQVAAIADPDRARAEACAREFGIERVFASPEAMLEGASLDALDI